jgi:hypothetical protein
MHRFEPNLPRLFVEARKVFQDGQYPGKLYRVRVPLREVPVGLKPRTIKQRQTEVVSHERSQEVKPQHRKQFDS